MNCLDKINEIKQLLTNHLNEECPYCGAKLVPFLHKDVMMKGCDCCDTNIIPEDYLNAINIVLNYGIEPKIITYKKLDEF